MNRENPSQQELGDTDSVAQGPDQEKENANFPNVSEPIGDVVADVYRVVSVIGHGGMGVVYLVEQVLLHKQYAMKVLNERFSDSTLRRFQNEAKAASALDHPNLVKAHHFGLLKNGTPYFIMDLVEGETLSAHLKRSGAMSVSTARALFIPICSALAHAHRNGVIHRDIKPSNIILTRSQEHAEDFVPKLCDFGIAKHTDTAPGAQADLTRTGEVFGTPFYMSPEQCLGRTVDLRSDIYSLGCVIFEALTGAPPFYADAALTVMLKHQSDELPTLKQGALGKEFPVYLENIIQMTLAKNPADRYQTCLELETVLRDGQTGNSFEEAFTSDQSSKPKNQALRRKSQLAWLGPVIGCLSAAALTLLFHHSSENLDAPISVDKNLGRSAGSRNASPSESIEMAANARAAPDAVASAMTRQMSAGLVSSGRNWLEHPAIVDQLPDGSSVYHFNGVSAGDKTASADGEIGWKSRTTGEKHDFEPAINDIRVPADADVNFQLNDFNLAGAYQRRVLSRLINQHSQPPSHFVELTMRQRYRALDNDADDGLYNDILLGAAHLKTLETLDLQSSPITIEGLMNLKIDNLSQLKSLILSETLVDCKDLAKLRIVHQVSYLGVNNLKNVHALLEALRNSQNIVFLDLEKTNLTDQDMRLIATMPNLEAVAVAENDKITDAGITELATLKKLQKLNVNNCKSVTQMPGHQIKAEERDPSRSAGDLISKANSDLEKNNQAAAAILFRQALEIDPQRFRARIKLLQLKTKSHG